MLSLYGERITRVAPDGTVTDSRLTVNGCTNVIGYDIVRAADAAMWFTGSCGLVRVPPSAGPGTVIAKESLTRITNLAADLTDGVWFTTFEAPGGGHADTGGDLTLVRRNLGRPSGVAVAPDGRRGSRAAGARSRASPPTATVTLHRVPIPVSSVAFDAVGGVWLASPARLVHTTLDSRPAHATTAARAARAPAAKRGSASPRCAAAASRSASASRRRSRSRASADRTTSRWRPQHDRHAVARAGTLRVRARRGSCARSAGRGPVQLLFGGRDREGNAIRHLAAVARDA